MTRKATRAWKAWQNRDMSFFPRRIRWRNACTKTPKQWAHWCQRLHLRKSGRGRGAYAWRSLIGCGRYWRINANGEFQASERYENFDRWANSTAATFTIPKTYTELLLRTKFTTYDT